MQDVTPALVCFAGHLEIFRGTKKCLDIGHSGEYKLEGPTGPFLPFEDLLNES